MEEWYTIYDVLPGFKDNDNTHVQARAQTYAPAHTYATARSYVHAQAHNHAQIHAQIHAHTRAHSRTHTPIQPYNLQTLLVDTSLNIIPYFFR